MNKKLTLIGAGPGGPDLITVKGAKTLAEADVILYDALIDKELLRYTREKAIRINVGKRKDNHTYSQEEINGMIVHFAKKGNHVARLKGGDPFVFGRGIEELEFATLHDIPVEVIPGITSAIAVPASVGIPITQRGVNKGFAIVTATVKNGDLSSDLLDLAKTNIPIVVLMGIHKIDKILELYEREGKSTLPVAVISNGTTAKEEVVIGTVGTLLSSINKEGIASPGIIVIGEIVSAHARLYGLSQNYNTKVIGYEN